MDRGICSLVPWYFWSTLYTAEPHLRLGRKPQGEVMQTQLKLAVLSDMGQAQGTGQGTESASYKHQDLWCRFRAILYDPIPFDVYECGDQCLSNFRMHGNHLGDLLTKKILGPHSLKS